MGMDPYFLHGHAVLTVGNFSHVIDISNLFSRFPFKGPFDQPPNTYPQLPSNW